MKGSKKQVYRVNSITLLHKSPNRSKTSEDSKFQEFWGTCSKVRTQYNSLLELVVNFNYVLQKNNSSSLSTVGPKSSNLPSCDSLLSTTCPKSVVVFHHIFGLADDDDVWALGSVLVRPRAGPTSLISLGRVKLCRELFWFWPLFHWNLKLFFLVWIGSARSATTLCSCQASTGKERPPWSSLEINFSRDLVGSGKIWGGDGILGMACQV